jgi:hypothetical protein
MGMTMPPNRIRNNSSRLDVDNVDLSWNTHIGEEKRNDLDLSPLIISHGIYPTLTHAAHEGSVTKAHD